MRFRLFPLQNLFWQYAVRDYNDKSNSLFHSVPDNQTLRVQQQVVSGMRYIFTVRMVESACVKNQVSVAQNPLE